MQQITTLLHLRLADIISPLYQVAEAWEKRKTPFPLRRGIIESRSLRRRLKKAVFWRAWKGVIIIQDGDCLEDNLKVRLGDNLEERFGDSPIDNLMTSLGLRPGHSLWDHLWGHLVATPLLDFGIRFRDYLVDRLGWNIYFSLQSCFLYTCSFFLTGGDKKTLKGFRELLALLAEGVIIAGFDREDRLVIYSPPAE